MGEEYVRRMGRFVVMGVSLVIALIAPAAATAASGGSGTYVTFAARVCPDYADITANKARNDIQESLRDLGPDTLYSGGDTVDAATEERLRRQVLPAGHRPCAESDVFRALPTQGLRRVGS
jgi:hypothetical protein